MKIRTPLTVGLVLALLLLAVPAFAATVGPTGHDRIPTAVPSALTPAVSCSSCSNDGEVMGIVQVEQPAGSGLNPTMVIGGNFTTLVPKAGPGEERLDGTLERRLLRRRHRRAPVLVPPGGERRGRRRAGGPLPNTVYVAGKFTTPARNLVLLYVNTGAVVSSSRHRR